MTRDVLIDMKKVSHFRLSKNYKSFTVNHFIIPRLTDAPGSRNPHDLNAILALKRLSSSGYSFIVQLDHKFV